MLNNKELINRNDWVLDKKAKICHCCQKEFIHIIRRRHHCRNCGNVFCDKCSNYFLKGHYFQWETKKEKKVRFCQTCYHQTVKILQLNGVQVDIDEKNTRKQLQIEKKSQSYSEEVEGDKQQILNKQSVLDEQMLRLSPNPLQDEQLEPHLKKESNLHEYEFNENTKSGIEYSSIYGQDNEQDDLASDINFEMDEIKQNLINLNDKLFVKLNSIIQNIMKLNNIDSQWFKYISSYTQQAIMDISIDKTYLSDYMDIMKYIKIKKIISININATSYLKGGLIFKKNVSHKKMQIYFKRPKIIVINGHLDAEETHDFEEILKNQSKQFKKVIDKLQDLQTNIIFVEKNVNSALLGQLQKHNITVVQGLSQCNLNKICKNTKSRKILHNSDIYKCTKQYCGSCDKLIFRNFQPQSIINNSEIYNKLSQEDKELLGQYIKKTEEMDPTILFIQSSQAINFIAITISGPSISQLQKVKQCLKTIIRVGYNLYLEKEQIAIDLRFQKKLREDEPVKLFTCGDITSFLFDQMDEQNLIENNFIEFSKAKYVKADLSDIHDIKEGNSNKLENYIKENYEHFNNKKIHHFCTNCSVSNKLKVTYYSTNDLPLGEYIQKKIQNQHNLCQKCKKPEKSHWTILYGPQCYVRINLSDTTKLQLRNSIYQSPQNPFIDMNQMSIELQLNQDANQDSLRKVSKSKRCEMFLECANCKKQLTESFKLKKMHLQYSFFRFIQRLYLTCHKHKEEDWLYNSIPFSNVCEHKTISRVFLYDDTKVTCPIFFIYFLVTLPMQLVQEMNDSKLQEELVIQEQIWINQKRTEILKAIDKISEVLKLIIKKIFSSSSPRSKDETQKYAFYQRITELQREQCFLFENTNFKDFLQLEHEAMKSYQLFNEQFHYLKFHKKMKENLETYGNLVNVFKSVSSSNTDSKLDTRNDRMINYLLLCQKGEKEKKQKKSMVCSNKSCQDSLLKNFMKFSQRTSENYKELKSTDKNSMIQIAPKFSSQYEISTKESAQNQESFQMISSEKQVGFSQVISENQKELDFIKDQKVDSDESQNEEEKPQTIVDDRVDQDQQKGTEIIKFEIKQEWPCHALNYNEINDQKSIFVIEFQFKIQ